MTVLVDQRALFREALAGLLSKARYSAIESVACIADVPEDLPADLLFIVNADACQGTADGLVPRDVATLRQQYPHAHLVVLGPCVDPRDVMAALQAGADAYILDTLTPDALVKSLELIMLGAMVLPAEFSHAMREAKNWASLGGAAPSAPMLTSDAAARHPARLSDMEARVLARLTVGACNKESPAARAWRKPRSRPTSRPFCARSTCATAPKRHFGPSSISRLTVSRSRTSPLDGRRQQLAMNAAPKYKVDW
jgi:two-component system nitrate/nitrite response regulator NarL